MHTYSYQIPGWMFHLGPIAAPDLEAAKAEIRKRLGVSRLPKGIRVWDVAARPMHRYRPVSESLQPLFGC